MRKFGKLLTVAMVFASICCSGVAASTEKPVSQLVIFGDSLSDIGNFPANYYSAAAGKNADAATALSDLTTNFYVPVCSPVFIGEQAYTVPMDLIFSGYNEAFSLSDLQQFDRYLPAQPPIDQVKREWHSYLWPQFLISYLNSDDMIEASGTQLWPWTVWADWAGKNDQQKTAALQQASVNYAWSGAMSDNQYHYPNGDVVSGATLQEMKTAWLAYLNDRQNYNLENTIIVPGLLKQIDFFIQDVKSGRIKVNNRTVYTVWSGGNDLFNAFNSLLNGGSKTAALKTLTYQTVVCNFKAVYRLIKEAKAQKVYVFNLFNVNMTPRINSDAAYSKFYIKFIINTLTVLYNKEMQAAAGIINKFVCNGRQVVQIVDVNKLFDAMSKGKKVTGTSLYDGDYSVLKFAPTYGEAGELSAGGEYFTAEASKANNAGYMFWNGIHPGMQVENVIGYVLKKAVAATRTEPAAPAKVSWSSTLNKIKNAVQGF